MARPKTAEDWAVLQAEITDNFTPGVPVRERDLLAGRLDQIELLLNAVRQRGRHAVIFGERGVGKTSLADTFALGLHSPTSQLIKIRVNANPNDSFSSLFKRVFKRLARQENHDTGVKETSVVEDYPDELTPDDVQLELDNFSPNSLPVIIIDEFDRIVEKEVHLLLADTIKTLSDYSSNCTLVVVGVAEDISSLIGNHESVSRQIIQVRMPRMKREELAKIIVDRLKRLDMHVEDDVLWKATFLSRGLPYFAHLLGQHSAIKAVEQRNTKIKQDHFDDGITAALKEVDQTMKEHYAKAIISRKPKETLYEPVLLACALAESDELGRFQQRDIEQPLAAIHNSDKKYKATTYAFHMNEFCEEKRGRVLERVGEEHNPRYRFRDPMMQPYAILRGIDSGRLTHALSERFIPQREPYFPIGFD